MERITALKANIINQALVGGVQSTKSMRNTGVEWIGEIPIDWKTVKFSHVASVKCNLVSPQDFGGCPQVSPENIEKGSGKLLQCKTVEESGVISGNHLFYEGQILYSKIRPKLNKVCIAPFSGLCSADIYPIESTQDVRFLMYSMLSDSFVGQVSMITEDRVKMPKINQNELGDLTFAVPNDVSEQQKISDYLDSECAKIDGLISTIKDLLSELDAYKKSLI